MTAFAASWIHPSSLAQAVAERTARLSQERFRERLLAHDSLLWPNPAAVATRLGWMGLPSSMSAEIPGFVALREEVVADGIRDVVLLGMGGSSLAGEVFSDLQDDPGELRLTILDTSHPATVAACLEAFPASTSLYVAASKSGTTVEMLALLDTFWAAAGDDPGNRFVAITDPGTPLARRAEEQGFRRLVLAPADVGGRYSALSPFGLLPAALIGIDCDRLLSGGAAILQHIDDAIQLGVLLAEAVRAGRDKLTLLADPALKAFLPWLEQLVAESLGKKGSGLVPVFGEPGNAHYGPDRAFVRLAVEGGEDSGPSDDDLVAAGHPVVRLTWTGRGVVGAEIMRWEVATAVAGSLLEIDPFDQPDVDLAKRLARAAMTEGAALDDPEIVDATDEEALTHAIGGWLATAAPGDYIAMQAFLPPTRDVLATLEGLRENLANTGLPTTLGFGPRFLHSTGQLHKGGRDGVFCLQLFDCGGTAPPVPGAGYTFRELIDAQALGDARALKQRGRSVLRVRLGD